MDLVNAFNLVAGTCAQAPLPLSAHEACQKALVAIKEALLKCEKEHGKAEPKA